ncbi:hypothetical protein BJ508DRAFT_381790 [Ascobolus immersus RN42]|uniref:Uncharacterized protein n=1 Tax=Ascobolus immersus RN42 TaxID=1160509 RepID=A0A3N4HEG2_ASCIM|nr:hypothetical protein BJ508DRAFT_381790 [Ascobolus immersus RN42]
MSQPTSTESQPATNTPVESKPADRPEQIKTPTEPQPGTNTVIESKPVDSPGTNETVPQTDKAWSRTPEGLKRTREKLRDVVQKVQMEQDKNKGAIPEDSAKGTEGEESKIEDPAPEASKDAPVGQ